MNLDLFFSGCTMCRKQNCGCNKENSLFCLAFFSHFTTQNKEKLKDYGCTCPHCLQCGFALNQKVQTLNGWRNHGHSRFWIWHFTKGWILVATRRDLMFRWLECEQRFWINLSLWGLESYTDNSHWVLFLFNMAKVSAMYIYVSNKFVTDWLRCWHVSNLLMIGLPFPTDLWTYINIMSNNPPNFFIFR